MGRLAGCCLRLCLLMLPLLAFGHEKDIEVTPEVKGTYAYPATAAACGQVLMLHGYHDNRHGVGGLQKKLAIALAARGIQSLRIDFRGEGQRNGYRATSTVHSRLEDAAAGYHYLRNKSDLPTGVLGWSLGGMTAMLLASDEPDWFQTMVVWSAAGDGKGLLVSDNPVINQAVKQTLSEGEASYESWAPMTLTREFLLSFAGVNVTDALGAYPGSFLSIRGDKDYLPADEKKWVEILSNPEVAYLTISEADHIFNVLAEKDQVSEQVIRHTVNWYLDQLCE